MKVIDRIRAMECNELASLLFELVERGIEHVDNEWCTKYCSYRVSTEGKSKCIKPEKEHCPYIDNDFQFIKTWLMMENKE